MCGGIQYQNQKIYFPQPNAKLPVMLRHGGIIWVLWSKRQSEGPGKFPNGGWARLDSIYVCKWKPWHPKPVLIPADSFLEKDHNEQSHWITLESGMLVHALLAERNDEHRVYIVNAETPPQYHLIRERWRRLISLLDQNKIARKQV